MHAKSKLVLNGNSDNQVEKQSTEQMVLGKQQHGSASTHASVDSMSEKNPNLSPPQGAYNKMIGIDSQIYDTSNTSQALEASKNSEVIDLNGEKLAGNKIVGESNEGHSTSILEKLFSSAGALNGVASSKISEVIVVSNGVSFCIYRFSINTCKDYYSGRVSSSQRC